MKQHCRAMCWIDIANMRSYQFVVQGQGILDCRTSRLPYKPVRYVQAEPDHADIELNRGGGRHNKRRRKGTTADAISGGLHNNSAIPRPTCPGNSRTADRQRQAACNHIHLRPPKADHPKRVVQSKRRNIILRWILFHARQSRRSTSHRQLPPTTGVYDSPLAVRV